MRRYAFVFATLLASSFVFPGAAPSGPSLAKPAAPLSYQAETEKPGEPGASGAQKDAIDSRLRKTLADFCSQLQAEGKCSYKVLFASVPDPVGTHLATSFDHDVAAIEDALQDSGYLFDRSYLPWEWPRPYDAFNDEQAAKSYHEMHKKVPGMLLFRCQEAKGDSPACKQPLIVLLMGEKPTAGINLEQVETARGFLKNEGIELKAQDQIQILGPTFSGSYESMVQAVHRLCGGPCPRELLIRSGSATNLQAAKAAQEAIRAAGDQVDLGSAADSSDHLVGTALAYLNIAGIPCRNVAILGESESLYGSYGISGQQKENQDRSCGETNGSRRGGGDPNAPGGLPQPGWSIAFPRDISSLRTSYDQQGVLKQDTQTQPWKHYLDLKDEAHIGTDSVRTYGGAQFTQGKEAVLFGIVNFIKTHDIRAVVIAASNEADWYFLAQFIHANASDVRVVVMGSSRQFTRGAMAQFLGDLAVSRFPMLPKLQDWTGGDSNVRVFENDQAQGVYSAARDLLGSAKSRIPGYDSPYWATRDGRSPAGELPVYLTALGSADSWPAAMDGVHPESDPAVQMPFKAFARFGKPTNEPKPAQISISRQWKELFMVCLALLGVYIAGFFLAEPVERKTASFLFPRQDWRYALLVFPPAALFGAAFAVLYWAVNFPPELDIKSPGWRSAALWMIGLGPAIVVVAALAKSWLAGLLPRLGARAWIGLVGSAAATAAAVIGFAAYILSPDRWCGMSVASRVLSLYREMHWGSRLSLLPTVLLLLLGVFMWIVEAGRGANLLCFAPPLPDRSANGNNERISSLRARIIVSAGMPLPIRGAFLRVWAIALAPMAVAWILRFKWPMMEKATSLEPREVTAWILNLACASLCLMLLDLAQFSVLWIELQGLLMAIDRRRFKRSFLPMREFDWKGIWSFGSGSFQERRKMLAMLFECLHKIEKLDPSQEFPAFLRQMAAKYNALHYPGSSEYLRDLGKVYAILGKTCGEIQSRVIDNEFAESDSIEEPVQPSPAAPDAAAVSRFADEAAECKLLGPLDRQRERFICLSYIGFIQTIVGRLRTLLMSVVSLFSFAALGFAIYPFEPTVAFVAVGAVLLTVVAGLVLLVFSQLEKDPVMARIVNGDPGKLELNFYVRMAEWMAVPLLTLVSSVLPGGAGRIIDVVQTLFSHGAN